MKVIATLRQTNEMKMKRQETKRKIGDLRGLLSTRISSEMKRVERSNERKTERRKESAKERTTERKNDILTERTHGEIKKNSNERKNERTK